MLCKFCKSEMALKRDEKTKTLDTQVLVCPDCKSVYYYNDGRWEENIVEGDAPISKEGLEEFFIKYEREKEPKYDAAERKCSRPRRSRQEDN